MGSTTASTSQKILNQADLQVDQNTYSDIVQQCGSVGTANNVVDIIGSSNVHLNVNQENSLTNMCRLSAAMKNKPTSGAAIDLFNKVAAAAQATGGLGSTDSKADQDIRNLMNARVSQDVYSNVLQTCMNESNTDNIIRVIGSKGIFADVHQVNKSLNECILNYAAENEATSTAALTAKDFLTAEATATGMQLGASGSSGFTSCCCFCIIVILCILALVLGSQQKKSNGSAGSPYMPSMMPSFSMPNLASMYGMRV